MRDLSEALIDARGVQAITGWPRRKVWEAAHRGVISAYRLAGGPRLRFVPSEVRAALKRCECRRASAAGGEGEE